MHICLHMCVPARTGPVPRPALVGLKGISPVSLCVAVSPGSVHSLSDTSFSDY